MARKRKISVKPFIPVGYRFLGLERYNMVLHDGCRQKEYLSYIEQNGIKRYITGLDEFAQSVTSIENETLRQEKIKEIRSVVADLEMKLIYNKVDVNDKDFWSNVKLLHATNVNFWSKIYIELTNNGLELDIKNDPNHLILYHCIKAGGFNTIAPSFKKASTNSNRYYFYLDTPEEMNVIETTEKKLKNKAIAILSTLEENKKHSKLLYLAKILLNNGTEYSFDNSIYELYALLDEYVSMYNNVLDNSSKFIKCASMPENELAVYALLSDLIALKKVYYKDIDGQFYCSYINAFLGRTVEDSVKYLLLPNNKSILNEIINKYKMDMLQIGFKSDIQIIKEQVENEVKDKVENEKSIEKNNEIFENNNLTDDNRRSTPKNQK